MNVVVDLPLERLDDGENVRRKIVLSASFLRSIETHGILQPITVAKRRGGRYTVILGHRRLAAARRLGLATIPAIVEDERPETELGLRQLAENLDRLNLPAIDVALALRAELDSDPALTQHELAKQLGRNPSWVANKLALLRLDAETQERIRSGELPQMAALLARPSRNDGRSDPRTELTRATASGARSASVVVPIRGLGKAQGRITVGVDRDEGYVDLVVSDGAGRSCMVTLSSIEARTVGRRLLQAHQALGGAQSTAAPAAPDVAVPA